MVNGWDCDLELTLLWLGYPPETRGKWSTVGTATRNWHCCGWVTRQKPEANGQRLGLRPGIDTAVVGLPARN